MEHIVEIIHNPAIASRNWGTICTCGWRGAYLDEYAAKKSKEIHLSQHEKTAANEVVRDRVPT